MVEMNREREGEQQLRQDEDSIMQFAKDWNFRRKSVKVPLPQT